MTNRDWTMETAKGDIYIKCANDKFQIEQSKVIIPFGDISYIQEQSKQYNLSGKLSDLCNNTEKFIGMPESELKAYANRFEIKSWVECVGPRMNKLINEAAPSVQQVQDEQKVQAVEAIEKAKTLITQAQAQPKQVISQPKQKETPKTITVIKTDERKASTTDDALAAPASSGTEEPAKPQGIRHSISNFFSKLFSFKFWK